jgi:hypothetical protein
VPDYPSEALAAAEAAIIKAAGTDFGSPGRASERLARAALDAAAPVLAEAVAQRILAHMEAHQPRSPAGMLEVETEVGRRYRTWRRHFRIAAQVASLAFSTREDQLRMAAEAIGRGDVIVCNPPEVPGEH